MRLLHGIVLTLLRILEVRTIDIVSKEDFGGERNNDHIQHRPEGTERRFVDDLDDKDWHISHLKDIDLDFKSDCKDDSFIDRVNKYRKALKEDGALVKYVSADALPVSESDLAVEKCVAVNSTTTKNEMFTKVVDASTSGKQIERDVVVTKEVDTATTADLKNNETHKLENKNATEKNARRASEYQFSSDEYSEEYEDFDDNFCPDFVDVINLEIDTLRSYDVECEMTVEWRSLE